MPKLGNVIDFAQLEAQNMRIHNLTSAPTTPVKGQMWYDSTPGIDTLKWYDGSAWQSAKSGTGGPPTGAATGDLTGSYPAPTIALLAVTDAKVAAANKDGAVGTPSMRTLGTGAAQAAAGNDSRFTDARAPTAHHTTHEPGGSDPLNVDAAVGTGSLRTLGFGAQQALPGTARLSDLAVPNLSVGLGAQKIIQLADPTAAQDAATKNYVDLTAQGLDAKASVFLATTTNIASITGTLSATIDGVSSVFSTQNANRRVLVKDQTAQAENGIYTITNIIAGTSYKLTRALDMDNWSEVPGSFVFVEEGTANADSGWVCTSDALTGGVPRVLGTDAMVWTQFSGAGAIGAGVGLVKVGNIISANPDAITLDVAGAGSSLEVKTGGISGTQLATSAVDLTSNKVTGALPLANGGTSQTTAKAARETGLGAAGYYSSAANPASATWTITQATHGLRASRGLMVQVRDEASGAWEVVDHSVNAGGDVTITWAVAQSGNTKRVIIIG